MIMKRSLLLLAACGGPSSSPAPALPPEPPALRPQPGMDLTGPIPLPDRSAPAKHSPMPLLDLAVDRAVVQVTVPQLPLGGSTGFQFADDRAGWVARIPDSVALPAVAYGNGKIYASGGFESVSFYGLDAKTGRIEWATTNLEDNGPTAPVYDEDRVIFNTESCTLFALDAKTGKRLWLKRLGDPTLAQTAVAGGLIFASHPIDGGGGQQLSAYRVKNGEEVWSHAIDGELLAAPVVAGDFVYASTIGGNTYKLARNSGGLAWARALAATTVPWVAGDELFVTRRNHGKEQQVVVSAQTGKVIREQQESAGGYAWDVPATIEDWKKIWQFEGSRPVVDRGVRYVAMGGEILASDAASGELLWKRRYAPKADKRSLGTVALAGSEIVVSTRDGELFGLDIDTGYTLWSYAIGHRVVAEPVIANGWIYAATTDGYVVALDVADPTLDGWHMFGGNPQHDGQVAPKPTVPRG
jgi:Ca-activated chloride channel family protein